MPTRFYLSGFSGTGTHADPYICIATTLQSSHVDFIDCRPYPEINQGVSLAWTINTDAEHVALIANSAITYLPFESLVGPIALTDLIGTVTSANISMIKSIVESHGVPTDNMALTMSLQTIAQMLCRWCLLGQRLRYLGIHDLVSMSQTIGDLPADRRSATVKRLTAAGLNVSGITSTTTIRAALLNLMSQPIATPFD